MRQESFSFFKPNPSAFGGSLQKGKRKSARPLNPKTTLHIVLKSSRARGAWSMLRHKTKIRDLLERVANENQIKIYQYSNVGNHLHLLVQLKDRKCFQKFLRVFSGRVALLVTGAKKGNAQGPFWNERPFTRIVEWGRDFKRMAYYFIKNELESRGYSGAFARNLVRRGFVLVEPGPM